MSREAKAVSTPRISELTIKVVYDNNPYADGFTTAWGFSCAIAGPERTILFDTGGDGSLLLNNMDRLELDPKNVDVVVLSHGHPDHTGGLGSFLEKNSKTQVYVPTSLASKFKEGVRRRGAKIVEVSQPLKICEDVYSTGQLGKRVKEQSLIMRTKAGVVLITGCAHPGILNIISRTQALAAGRIVLLMGGFHLEWASKAKIEKIISAFKQLQVKYVGPCHCNSEKARTLLQKHFGKNYLNIGAGRVITTADFQ